MNQNNKFELFKSYHSKSDPLILLNIWDLKSKELAEKHGEKVLATSSYAMADSNGYLDGENIPFSKVLSEFEKITKNTSLPVTVDIESGYAKTDKELENNIKDLIKLGIIGINLEDRVPQTDLLYSINEFRDKIRIIKQVTKDLFINVRTDMFFYGDITNKNKDRKLLQDTIIRIKEYEISGADGIFIPGLKNKEFIKEITENISIPLNIMLDYRSDDINEFKNLGISRFSFGPTIYLKILEISEKIFQKNWKYVKK